MNLKREPEKIGDLLKTISSDKTLGKELLIVEILKALKHSLGNSFSKNLKIHKFSNGKLFIEASSSAWRAEVLLRRETIVSRLNEYLGKDVISEVIVR